MPFKSNFWKTHEPCSICVKRTRNLDEFTACIRMVINRKRGDIFMTMGRWDDAETVYEANVRKAQRIGHKEILAENKADLGTILFRKGKPRKALRLLQDSYHVFRRKNDKMGQNFTLLHMGIIHEQMGNYAKALECYEQQHAIARKIGFKHDIAIAIGNKGVIYYHLGRYAIAIECYKKQLALSRDMSDTLNMAIVHGNLGIVYQNLGNPAKGIAHYEKSLKLSEQLGYKLGISIALANLGSTYANLGEYDKAFHYHQKNLEIAREMGNRQGESYALGNIGVLWMNQGKFTKAIDCFTKTRAISEALSDRKSMALAFGNLGKAHKAKREYRTAKGYLQKAVHLLRETGVKFHLCHFLFHSAETHFALKNYEIAALENDEALSIAKEIKREDAIFACKLLAARMASLTDRKGALSELEFLLKNAKHDQERAQLHYWIFKISKKKSHKENARKLYGTLAKRTPNVIYQSRLRELSKT